jgi:hypothetical protein
MTEAIKQSTPARTKTKMLEPVHASKNNELVPQSIFDEHQQEPTPLHHCSSMLPPNYNRNERSVTQANKDLYDDYNDDFLSGDDIS